MKRRKETIFERKSEKNEEKDLERWREPKK